MLYTMLIYQAADVAATTTDDDREACLAGHRALQERSKAGDVFRAANELVSVDAATTVRWQDGTPAIIDGPFAETKEQLVGLYVMECASLDEAIDYAKGHPPAGRRLHRDPPHRLFRGAAPGIGAGNPRCRPTSAQLRAAQPKALATLIRLLGDIDMRGGRPAGSVSRVRLRSGRKRGVPDNPVAWLVTTGRNHMIDQIRRRSLEARHMDSLRSIAPSHAPGDHPEDLLRGHVEDDLLRLIFTCCHPALAPEAQIALTLKTVAGLSVDEIAQRLPDRAQDHGAAADPRETQDHRRRHTLRSATAGEASGTAGRRAGGRLSDLQRRLQRFGRRPDRLRRAMATFRRMGTIGGFREKFVAGMIANGYTPDYAERWLQADRGVRRLRLPRIPRRQLRAAGLCLGLAQMPLPGGVRLRAAEQPADGVLRPRPDRPRRPRPRRRGAAGRRQPQRVRLHPGAAGRRRGRGGRDARARARPAPRPARDQGLRPGRRRRADGSARRRRRLRRCPRRCGRRPASMRLCSSGSPMPTPSPPSASTGAGRCGRCAASRRGRCPCSPPPRRAPPARSSTARSPPSRCRRWPSARRSSRTTPRRACR